MVNGCNGGGVCKCVLCNLNCKIPEDLSTENLECLVLEFVFRFIVISIFFFKSIHEFMQVENIVISVNIHIERYN